MKKQFALSAIAFSLVTAIFTNQKLQTFVFAWNTERQLCGELNAIETTTRELRNHLAVVKADAAHGDALLSQSRDMAFQFEAAIIRDNFPAHLFGCDYSKDQLERQLRQIEAEISAQVSIQRERHSLASALTEQMIRLAVSSRQGEANLTALPTKLALLDAVGIEESHRRLMSELTERLSVAGVEMSETTDPVRTASELLGPEMDSSVDPLRWHSGNF